MTYRWFKKFGKIRIFGKISVQYGAMKAKRNGKNIIVDFDGVLNKIGTRKGENEPFLKCRKGMQVLRDLGYNIIIYPGEISSALQREDIVKDRKETIKAFLAQHNIPYDEICTFLKFSQDAIINSRNVEFNGDWEICVSDVVEMLNKKMQ